MANCTASDVRLIVNTNLTDLQIGTLIDLVDAEMTARGLTGSAWTTNLKKMVSMLLTASYIALRDPLSQSIGDYNLTVNKPQVWREMAEDIIGKAEIPFLAHNEPR